MEFEIELLPRLTKLLGDADLGNGTPLADAVAVAIGANARSAGVDGAAVRALPDEVLLESAEAIHRCVSGTRWPHVLPFGAPVTGTRPISIGGRVFFADAARPGLHSAETLRGGVHGPNLDRLLALIKQRTRSKPYRAIPLPTPESVLASGLQCELEFPPFAASGGVVLRHAFSTRYGNHFCALTLYEVETLAKEISNAMAAFWKARFSIGQRVEEIRRDVQGLLIREHGPNPPVTIRSVSCQFENRHGRTNQRPWFGVDYNSLDSALRPNAVHQPIHWECIETDVDRYFYPELQDEWNVRSRCKAESLAKGSIGEMDDFAAAIICAAPEGERAVLDRLSENLETNVFLPCDETYINATLTWDNGRVKCFLRHELIKSWPGGCELRGGLPRSIIASAVGQPMSAIAELPFKFDGVIAAVEEVYGGGLSFEFVPKLMLIDAETGALRPA
jgi:hypothetical protein